MRAHVCDRFCRWIDEDEMEDELDEFERWLPVDHELFYPKSDTEDEFDINSFWGGTPSYQQRYINGYPSRIYLNVDYHEKDEVKAKGARWDPLCPRTNNPEDRPGKWCALRSHLTACAQA
jgi:hypothetical protein